jgi:glycosyltransferase involved in cell wall biosynthesis
MQDVDSSCVTVGLPFRNCERTLLDAVRSVFAQTHSAWRLLLVDDGSTDGSLQIATRIHDPRVQLYSDGQASGLSARLNQIARMTETDYLARMDADDVMHPHRLAAQFEFLRDNPHVDVVGTAVFSVDATLAPVGVRAMEPLTGRLRTVLAEGLFCHPTICGRSEWFRANPYDSRFPRGEDHELWCRTEASSVFETLCRPLYFYREVGHFNLSSYRGSCETDRQIFRKYGPAIVGRTGTAVLIVRSHLKYAIYRVCAAVGLADRLVLRRSRPLTPEESADALSALRSVRGTAVPMVS